MMDIQYFYRANVSELYPLNQKALNADYPEPTMK